MPVFRKRVVFEAARSIRVWLKVEAGVARDRVVGPALGPDASRTSGAYEKVGTRSRKLEQIGQRIAGKVWTLGAKARQRQTGGKAGSIDPKNIVWIFGIGRTGSTWLSRIMGELRGHTVWFEPWVGALFDSHLLRLEHRKGKHFILAPHYKKTWLGSIRSFVLDGVRARFSEVAGPSNYLVIKEPGGSVGAPLLMEALPESRMIFLVRDPRDIAASSIDAVQKNSWQYEGRRGWSPESSPGGDPNAFVEAWSNGYLHKVGSAKQAYDAHEGRKVLVRYEELRADTLGTMKRIYSTLELPVEEGELLRAVEKHSWESISEEKKGKGKFYRKAKPGSWRNDLSPEQAQIVERITAPLLRELYPS